MDPEEVTQEQKELFIIATLADICNDNMYNYVEVINRMGLERSFWLLGLLREVCKKNGYAFIQCLVYCPEDGLRHANYSGLSELHIDLFTAMLLLEVSERLWFNKYITRIASVSKIPAPWAYNDLRLCWRVCRLKDVEIVLQKLEKKYPDFFPTIIDRSIFD